MRPLFAIGASTLGSMPTCCFGVKSIRLDAVALDGAYELVFRIEDVVGRS